MTTTHPTRTGGLTGLSLWLLPGFVAWLGAFTFLAPGEYIRDWAPWMGATVLMSLPLILGLGLAIQALRLHERVALLAVLAHGILVTLFVAVPLAERIVRH